MFATDPVCCPARATLLTGMYPHNTEVFNSQGGLEKFRRASKSSIGVRLRKAGYTTAFIGQVPQRLRARPVLRAAGWDEWFGLAGKKFLNGYDYGANHNGRMEQFGEPYPRLPDRCARAGRATEFVDEQADERQAVPADRLPDGPALADRAGPRDTEDNRVRRRPAPRPQELRRGPVRQADVAARDLPGPIPAKKQGDRRRSYRNGLGSLMAVDDMVAVDRLPAEAADELDNTVFIFTSDNGYSFGSHRVAGKLAPYDETTRVPLAIAGPGIAQPDRGRAGRPHRPRTHPVRPRRASPTSRTWTACRSYRCSEARRTFAGGRRS